MQLRRHILQSSCVGRRLPGVVVLLLASGLGVCPAGANPVPAFPVPTSASIAPSQVTPRTIAPLPTPALPPVFQSPVEPPPEDPGETVLAVDLGDAHVVDGFAEMDSANAGFVAALAHRHVTLAQITSAAHALEQAYGRHGYILVRVVVPPQRIEPGAPVSVRVIDGFVEALDLSHVAPLLRGAVGECLHTLIGRHHVTQNAIERAMLLAGDIAGARLRSAIVPGTATGGVQLAVEGSYVRTEGQIGADNALPATLGRWQFSGNIVRNGLMMTGDQAYLTLGSQAAIGSYGFPKAPLAMIGGGYVLPLDNEGPTLTGEVLNSRTQPHLMAGVPPAVGEYTRELLRLSIPLVRTRAETLRLTPAARCNSCSPMRTRQS